MTDKQKLGNPYFIGAVATLLINDWYLKQAYHNQLTGKLSDFSGLFAFPFFLSALLPRRAVSIYLATLLLFIMWKSPLVQPFIDSITTLGIPLWRVVDYSDYLALLVMPLSFFVFKTSSAYHLKPVLLNFFMVVSALSFVATSMVRGKYTKITGINKTYTFNFSKRDLVSRINSLQLEYVRDFENSVRSQNKLSNKTPRPDSAWIDFDSKANIFYYSSTLSKKDTIARILDYERLKDADTIRLRTMYADINISGNSTRSELKLLGLVKFVAATAKTDDREIAIGFFEKGVIKKIKSYGK
ncbi:hypothetical protein IDJ77_23995 [Mucilaginibacter sp. ZT4R22]|uniref:Uncharacterized protein n=1 Tax=Mucilaginibacter pankratovii TaxID=2772110 RepID=A0ABR7WX96_9SPHI|nr:hypothetical protein [Mucilaginibacter pankratovii]MBD1366894.1 hypothetical protein [Mucilaginibacter pankratovii]